jgi:hypothetical protein
MSRYGLLPMTLLALLARGLAQHSDIVQPGQNTESTPPAACGHGRRGTEL